MRLTSVLFKLHKGRRFKVLWKLEANRKLVEYPVPQILIEKGVKIWEAKDIADPPPKLEM